MQKVRDADVRDTGSGLETESFLVRVWSDLSGDVCLDLVLGNYWLWRDRYVF